ncbi:MAG: photosynthetic reaction center cytochrome PufC [Rubrivivax sp.]|jgi:photosynthetic reaction center cytochrome c subunit|nr:photosynthetic reaction center cytochrome PufC [Rubrivivax sp.]
MERRTPSAAALRGGFPKLVVWALLAILATLAGCERTDAVQRGFRGTGMLNVYDAKALAAAQPIHAIPDPEPVDPPDPEAPSVDEAFKNIQVLRDLTVLEISRLMQAMSTWVAPEEGCDFCHNPRNLASDEKYAKVVARKMLLMTREINTRWKSHVGDTGVTCWTCHRGQAVPSGDWFSNPAAPGMNNLIGNRNFQNEPGIKSNGNTSLPNDALSVFLERDDNIRVQGESVLRTSQGPSIKQAEWTYSLMMYMSNSLGVNCTYCHNTRALAPWDQSSPPRVTAWHGIRMVRSLNVDHLEAVGPLLPPIRWSATGDFPKVGCDTCHKGAFKPMNGVSMLPDYPELAGVMVRAPAAAASAAN